VFLINEDFRVVFRDIYSEDGILPFEVDCDDGTELFIEKIYTERNTNPFSVLKKYFSEEKTLVNVDDFPGENIAEINKINNLNYNFVTFQEDPGAGVERINMSDYMDVELFLKFSLEEQRIIKSKILDIYYGRKR
jgi:hypothetical protein